MHELQFACHLPTCNRLFTTPKTRQLHLIQGHGCPKEYFFAVTNKGEEGLLKKGGEGASLIRKEWKPREQQRVEKGNKAEDVEMEGNNENSDDDGGEEEEEEEIAEDRGRSAVVFGNARASEEADT